MLHGIKIVLALCLMLSGCAPMSTSLMQNSVFSSKDETRLHYPESYRYLKSLNAKLQDFEVNAAIKGAIAGAAVGATAGALTGDVKNAAVGGILGGIAGGSAAYVYVLKNRTVIGNAEERFLQYLADAETDSENFNQVNSFTREGIRAYTQNLDALKRNQKKYSSREYQERLREISDGLGILRKFYGLCGEEYNVVKERYANVVTEEKKMYSASKKAKSISQREYNKAVSDLKKTEAELSEALVQIEQLRTEYSTLEKQLLSSEEEIKRLEVNIVAPNL